MQQVTKKGNPIHLTAYLSAEILQARREWQDIFKVLKGENLQLDYCTRQGSHSKLTENENSQETQQKKRDLQNQPQTIKKMTIGTYISINYFKCKWIKCSNQKTQTG